MQTTMFAVLLVFAADDIGGGGGAEFESGNAESGLECTDDLDDDELPVPPDVLEPFERLDASPGGGWWWLQIPPTDYSDTFDWRLVSLDREATWALGYADAEPFVEVSGHATLEYSPRLPADSDGYAHEALAVESPSDATPGERFELRDGERVVASLSIADEARAPTTFSSLSISLVNQVAEVCGARCESASLSIPRLPVLEIVYDGAPAVLSMRLSATCDDLYRTDLFIGAFALSATSEPLLVIDPRDRGVQGNCEITHVDTALVDPETGVRLVELATESLGTLAEAPVVLYEDGEVVEKEECNFFSGTIWDPDTRREDFGLPCACVTVGGPRMSGLVALSLVFVALSRRRARAEARST